MCESSAWIDVPCRGPRGCARPAGQGADECDDTIAAETDRCPADPPLDYACSPDRAEALVCKNGRFSLWRRCRGAAGCEVEDGRNVRCDTSAGEAGDPCGKSGTYACSTDGKTMLLCDGTVLVPASSCRGASGCHVDVATRKVDCDDSVASVGDPCDEPRRIACTLDHKAELVCSGGAAQDRPDAGAQGPARVAGRYEKRRDCKRTDCSIGGSELFCD